MMMMMVATAFVPHNRPSFSSTTTRRSSAVLLHMVPDLPPFVSLQQQQPPVTAALSTMTKDSASLLVHSQIQPESALSRGTLLAATAATANSDNKDVSSSSMTLSLQEIKKVTAEEIAAKKFTFNAIFWGGGFVAPLLATVFYFGAKFWEK